MSRSVVALLCTRRMPDRKALTLSASHVLVLVACATLLYGARRLCPLAPYPFHNDQVNLIIANNGCQCGCGGCEEGMGRGVQCPVHSLQNASLQID